MRASSKAWSISLTLGLQKARGSLTSPLPSTFGGWNLIAPNTEGPLRRQQGLQRRQRKPKNEGASRGVEVHLRFSLPFSPITTLSLMSQRIDWHFENSRRTLLSGIGQLWQCDRKDFPKQRASGAGGVKYSISVALSI